MLEATATPDKWQQDIKVLPDRTVIHHTNVGMYHAHVENGTPGDILTADDGQGHTVKIRLVFEAPTPGVWSVDLARAADYVGRCENCGRRRPLHRAHDMSGIPCMVCYSCDTAILSIA
jgi:hypothetical protein